MGSSSWFYVALAASGLLLVLTALLNTLKEEEKNAKKAKTLFIGIYIFLLISTFATCENHIASSDEKKKDDSVSTARYDSVIGAWDSTKSLLAIVKDDVKDLKKAINKKGYNYDSVSKVLVLAPINYGREDNSVHMSSPTFNAPSQNGGTKNKQTNRRK